jgi:transcriptional regulator with GAF, ATPase, and Fis domain
MLDLPSSYFPRLNCIKTKSVFTTIREISEILSLSNEADKLVNMALDTLSQVLSVDCCWIQTIDDRKHKKLLLAAERGFSPEIRQEVAAMDMSHSFSEQILGLGHKIIIPDLSNDGLYGLPSFRKTGYKWLVAVPLMTYRAHGILGIASRNRKLLKKDTADLVMVIAGLIATSLSKSHLSRQLPALEKPANAAITKTGEELKTTEAKQLPISAQTIKEELKTTEKKSEAPLKTEAPIKTPPPLNPPQNKPAKRPDGPFHSHARKMEQFRKTHR